MTIDIAGIKALRLQTSAGVMDCKRALIQAGGEVDVAAHALQARWPADLKVDRPAPEGLIACLVEGRRGVLIEVATETDFVCRNHDFRDGAMHLARMALDCEGERERLLASPFAEGGKGASLIRRLALRFGENIFLRNIAALETRHGAVGAYLHNSPRPGLGRQAALVAISGGTEEARSAFAPKLAMHVVGASPLWTDVDQVPASIRTQKRGPFGRDEAPERAALGQIDLEIAARLERFYEMTVLLRQPYLPDPACTVAQKITSAVGPDGRVEGFVRLQVGEDASHDALVTQAAELEWTFGNDWSKEHPGELIAAGDILLFAVSPRGPKLVDDRDAVDLINAAWSWGSSFIALPVDRLPEDFFRLSTRKAGTILQKFSNLGARLAIVGDISEQLARSIALRDFVYESNSRDQIWFVPELGVLLDRLKRQDGRGVALEG